MPTPLLKPIDVSSVHTDTAKTIKVSWVTPTDTSAIKDYGFQFLKKADATVLTLSETATPSAPAVEGKNTFSTISFREQKEYDSFKTTLAQVQAHTNKPDQNTDSAWGTETVWSAAPTLTVTIGSKTYTLSQSSFGGATSTIYKLPVSAENPLSITYNDMKEFAATLPGSPTLPTTYPNGTLITGSLDISELIIDTGKKLFSLSIAAVIPYEIFPGLKVEKLGLSMKRTDGSL